MHGVFLSEISNIGNFERNVDTHLDHNALWCQHNEAHVPIANVTAEIYTMRMDCGKQTGMWFSRPGLGLETDQDHFFEVLVLVSTLLVLVLVLASLVLVSACVVSVLVSEGGLEQDLRLCATTTLLVSKVETSK